VTIRAFRQAERFSQQSESHLHSYIRASYASNAASQWLNFRLQMMSVLMITLVGITALIQHVYSTANASLIGLALSYILSVTGLLNGLIGSFTETEKEMVCVERAHQFQNLESENWHGVEPEAEHLVTRAWPALPSIEFTNVVLKYTSDEASQKALANVSFRVNAGEKVGICGRTGSGKSSLLTALFRGCELTAGSIRVDNVNVAHIGLSELRSKLSIIPQDPFLFEGSLRENLDPSGQRTEAELWAVLHDVRLESKFRSSEYATAGLDTIIAEKGKNLSTGERQLVCLARAMLTSRPILCIDEATAAVDYETDRFIQETIRSQFTGVTVLTIAHRINTIVDCDRILVMDGGRVAEFDTPSRLLANKASLFYSLVNESKAKS
jgi:ATP-binding cassette subfamily C (CFTR/MRP) protein 10